MNNMRKSIVRGIAAMLLVSTVSCSTTASAAWSEDVFTQTLDGVQWRFKIDESNKTALLGSLASKDTVSDAAQYWATVATRTKVNNINVKDGLRGVVEVPSSFTVDGVAYDLVAIGNRALIRYGMSTLILPENVGTLWNCALYQMPYLTNLWFKGHATLPSEFGREYVSLEFTASTVLSETKAIKNILVGPNIKRSGTYFYTYGTDTLVLFPYRKDNTTWTSGWNLGTTPKVVYYYDLDEAAGTITFSPASATALAETFATLPTIAPQIKTAFGLDAKVVVETPIEEATTIPAAFLASGIPLETTEWVAFTATTQEQLQDVLDACSTSSRILIDPAGATGRLDVPAGRNVAMLMSPDSEVAPERVGFMLIVK